MAVSQLLGVVEQFQLFECELADCLEDPKALGAVADEVLVDERLQQVELRLGDLLGGIERAAAGEHGQPREERLFPFVEQLVAPLEGRAQRLLPSGASRAPPVSNVEALSEPLDDLLPVSASSPAPQLARARAVAHRGGGRSGTSLVRLEARLAAAARAA